MKRKSNKNHAVIARPTSKEKREENVMQTALNSKKPDHKHKFIWDPKKLRLTVDIKDPITIPIRSEDISHR
ncbi:MAG: hypothetical protein AMJ75_02540 [Phycisphaerae bacterium SM1_79]|nr:MAG: hypothetical protein AMJ75_02540 [Phycisphaerae bacterium SM1_79]